MERLKHDAKERGTWPGKRNLFPGLDPIHLANPFSGFGRMRSLDNSSRGGESGVLLQPRACSQVTHASLASVSLFHRQVG